MNMMYNHYKFSYGSNRFKVKVERENISCRASFVLLLRILLQDFFVR